MRPHMHFRQIVAFVKLYAVPQSSEAKLQACCAVSPVQSSLYLQRTGVNVAIAPIESATMISRTDLMDINCKMPVNIRPCLIVPFDLTAKNSKQWTVDRRVSESTTVCRKLLFCFLLFRQLFVCLFCCFSFSDTFSWTLHQCLIGWLSNA